MTRLRQGELLALRWLDLDGPARKVRVRQELRNASPFTPDDDLVFAHPLTGNPLDRSFAYKRFKRARRRAGVQVVRFHDLGHTFGTRVAASGEVSLCTLGLTVGSSGFYAQLAVSLHEHSDHRAERRGERPYDLRLLDPHA